MMEKIIDLCRENTEVETGGILIGQYSTNHDLAIVTDISGPPKDSSRAYTTFSRGIKGLQKWLNQIWKSRHHYYLGEWHYHPHASPAASSQDVKQLKEHSENKTLMCPEPIMVIVGGDPHGLWTVGAYVFPKNKNILTMQNVE